MSELEARPPSEREPVAGVTAASALAGLQLAGRSAATLDRIRLSPIVAATLRSALDALLGETTTRRPLTVASDDAVLDLRCPSIDPAGLRPAGAMLEMIGGQLGLSLERGVWSVRVPTMARASYLMVEQGTLKLAVPWHSVARVRLVPNEMIESMARRQGYTLLPPLARAGEPAPERPAILIGHGLKRAWMVADRLVWRMPAEQVLAPETPGRHLGHAVQTDDGEVFWVLDPARVLRDVELPPLPDPAPHAPVAPRIDPPPAPPRPRVIELRRPEVEPLHDEPATVSESAPAGSIGAEPAAGMIDDEVEPGAETVAQSLTPPTVTPAETGAAIDPGPVALVAGLDHESVEPLEGTPILEEAAGVAPVFESFDELAAGEAEVAPAPVVAHEPRPAATAGPVAETQVPAGSPAPRRRRALVAEDSITARIFLARLLEHEGFEVHDVATARELHALLAREPWSIVFVDVELPDAHGLAHLIPWTAGPKGAHLPFPVVALVRDRADELMAEEAGVRERLPKPFEREILQKLLETLGLAAAP